MFGGMKQQGKALLLIISIVAYAQGKERRARSLESFNKLISAAPYSLAIFYNRDKTAMRNDATKSAINDMEIMLRSLSKNPRYKAADLQIIRVDIARRDLDETVQRYNLSTLPAFMTFIGREPTDQRISGFAYRSQVKALIKRTLKQKMDIYLHEKQKQRNRQLKIARIRAYNRAYLWGSYWPYWYSGYYPYWQGPYYGTYFGW